MDIIDADFEEITEGAEGAPEQGPEDLPDLDVSPELERLRHSGDEPEGQGEPGAAVEGKASTKKEPSRDDVQRAAHLAEDAAGFLFGMVQKATGKDYGLNQAAAVHWAGEVAPCLAKYQLTSTAGALQDWGAEIKAAVATGALLFGVWMEHKRYQEAEAKAQQNKETMQAVAVYAD